MPVPKRLSVKLPFQNPDVLNLAAVVPVLQRWIQQHTIEGLLIDVVDYKHVAGGPGVLLIGHEGDYGVGYTGDIAGLEYTLKREPHHSLTSQLTTALRRAIIAARQLEAETDLTFSYHNGKFSFIDRLQYPNTPETLDAVQSELIAVLTPIFDTEPILSQAHHDPRAIFTVNFDASTAMKPDALLVNLGAAGAQQ